MSDDQGPRQRARYRFDPHTEGIFLGLGRVRLALLLVVLAAGVGALYGGSLVVALAFTTILPILVIWTREGIPALVWMPLRLAYRLGDADGRGWSLDPELVPHADRFDAPSAASPAPGVPPGGAPAPGAGPPGGAPAGPGPLAGPTVPTPNPEV